MGVTIRLGSGDRASFHRCGVSMSRRRPFFLPLTALLYGIAWFPSSAAADRDLLTVAESSDYRATARYGQVMELAERLAGASESIRLDSLGESFERRQLPLLWVANPPVRSPEELSASGKQLVLLVGNIHSGEACGKEALLMLVRELGTTADHPLLEKLVLAVVPVYNADATERVSLQNRPRQNGPHEGAGERINAQGLDLNRDWIKLEAPETRAFVRFLRRWDPDVVIDTHTTNGSYHRYTLTYAGPKHPAGQPALTEFVRETLLGRVGERVREAHGWRTYHYGNFADDHSKWTTYPDHPRYGTPYRGLRGRVAILTEAYAYASFKDRVLATRDFVRACLEYCAAESETIEKLLRAVDEATEAAGRDGGSLALRTEARSVGAPERVLGFVEAEKDGERISTGEPREYEVDRIDRFEAVHSVERPFAYLLPPSLRNAIENLQRHGVRMETLREDVELDVEVYRIDDATWAEREFQGHRLATVEATPRQETRRVAAGTLVVRSAQPLGSLAAYLLEPEAADGLVAWNFFDDAIVEGGDFPVLRLAKSVPLLLADAPALEEDRGPSRPIDFEALYGGEERPPYGSPEFITGWKDEEHYLVRRDGTSWSVNARTGRAAKAPTRAAVIARNLATLPTIDESAADSLARGAQISEDGVVALVEHGRDLYVALAMDLEPVDDDERRSSFAWRLTSGPDEEELATLSPDREFVAFVREDDLWVVDLETATERRLTTDGGGVIRNGKASWVYFEEIFGRRWKTYWWSPDSRSIAFFRTDSTPVGSFSIADDRETRQQVDTTRYPKPGEANPTVRLGIAPVSGARPRFVDLSEYDPSDLLLAGCGWWPDSSGVYFYAQNRIQSWLDFLVAPRNGGTPKRFFRQETGAWVDQPLDPMFLEDGSFLVTSEESGWRHLVRVDPDGERVAQVTSGEWEVRGVEGFDAAKEWLYLRGTRDSPIAENLYRVRIEDGTVERLTPGDGHHRVSVGPGAKYFVASVSSHRGPGSTDLFDGAGQRVRTIDSNPMPTQGDWFWCAQEYFEIEARDGTALQASLLRPPGFDSGKRYPVWLTTYAGPHAPSIRDTWSGGRPWDQMVAQSGIVVFRVDPRSASGRGAVSAWACYKQLGVPESRDLIDAIRWLRSQPWVDADRIGMSGHSFGGYITAFTMTQCDLLAAGIAGAPVTDWREYDTIYTERYMQTPQLNPDGYDATSAVLAADRLHGRLLILHGAIDDNVHLQNTTRLVDALQRAGKQFELMIYPGNRHGLWGQHYQRLRYDFIQRTVGRESAAGGGSTPRKPGHAVRHPIGHPVRH